MYASNVEKCGSALPRKTRGGTGARLCTHPEIIGIPTVSDKTLPCGLGNGFDEEGIVGTPVIDPTTNTIAASVDAGDAARVTVRRDPMALRETDLALPSPL